MTDVRENAPHRVVTLVRSGVLPMELGIVHRLFGTAVGDDGRPLYSVVTCATEPGELATDADFTVNVALGPQALGDADTVLVPAATEDYEP